MTRTRFFSSSLATLAVASAVTLATPGAPGAFAADCVPGSPAVFGTVVVPAQTQDVPARTHIEWRWTREVSHTEYEYSRVLTPSSVEVDWTRTVPGVTEYLWSRTVVTQAYVPAVPAVPAVTHEETVVVEPAVLEYLYHHQVTDNERWEAEDWGAQNGKGSGWELVPGVTREVVPAVTETVTVVDEPAIPEVPAVPEISHVDSVWAAESPGAGWTQGDSRTSASTTETTTTDGSRPAGDGWSSTATRVTDAVVDTVWGSTPPAEYVATGNQRTVSSTETTDATSAAAPAGDGWSHLDGSAVEVVDEVAHTVVTSPETTHQVVIKAAVPASGTCVDGVTGDPGGSGSTTVSDPTIGDGDTVVAAPQAAPSASAQTTLPNTGNEASLALAEMGFAAVLAGALLVALGRRRRDA